MMQRLESLMLGVGCALQACACSHGPGEGAMLFAVLSRWMHVADAAWMLRPGAGCECELPQAVKVLPPTLSPALLINWGWGAF